MNKTKVETGKKQKPAQKSFFEKCAGQTRCTVETPKANHLLISFIGGFLGILVVAYLCIEAQRCQGLNSQTSHGDCPCGWSGSGPFFR